MAFEEKKELAGASRALCAARLRDALRCIDGRWKLPILAHLAAYESMRFSDIERLIPEASQKMLTQHLRELEGDAVVTRVVHAEVPPRVEYRLTSLGEALRSVFEALADWEDVRNPYASLTAGALTRGEACS